MSQRISFDEEVKCRTVKSIDLTSEKNTSNRSPTEEQAAKGILKQPKELAPLDAATNVNSAGKKTSLPDINGKSRQTQQRSATLPSGPRQGCNTTKQGQTSAKNGQRSGGPGHSSVGQRRSSVKERQSSARKGQTSSSFLHILFNLK